MGRSGSRLGFRCALGRGTNGRPGGRARGTTARVCRWERAGAHCDEPLLWFALYCTRRVILWDGETRAWCVGCAGLPWLCARALADEVRKEGFHRSSDGNDAPSEWSAYWHSAANRRRELLYSVTVRYLAASSLIHTVCQHQAPPPAGSHPSAKAQKVPPPQPQSLNSQAAVAVQTARAHGNHHLVPSPSSRALFPSLPPGGHATRRLLSFPGTEVIRNSLFFATG